VAAGPRCVGHWVVIGPGGEVAGSSLFGVDDRDWLDFCLRPGRAGEDPCGRGEIVEGMYIHARILVSLAGKRNAMHANSSGGEFWTELCEAGVNK
jgi:hypothetical protein